MRKIFLLIFLVAMFCSVGCNSCGKNKIEKQPFGFADILSEGNNVDFSKPNAVEKYLGEYEQNNDLQGNFDDFCDAANSYFETDADQLLMLAQLTKYAARFFCDNQQYCDSAIIVLCNFVADMPQKYLPYVDEICEEKHNTQVDAIRKNLTDAGYVFWCSDNDYEYPISSLSPDPAFLYNNLGSCVSAELHDYLQTLAKYPNGITDDAALLMNSYGELWSFILVVEKLAKKYPQHSFFTNHTIDEDLNEYTFDFLMGLDNDEIYNYDTKKINQDLVDLYKTISQKASQTDTEKKVAAYYNLIKKNNFKYDSKFVYQCLNIENDAE